MTPIDKPKWMGKAFEISAIHNCKLLMNAENGRKKSLLQGRTHQ